MGTHPIFESDFDCLTDCLKMPKGTNSQGNSYGSNSDGSYWYNNQNGSHYSSRGAHEHYTNPSGNGVGITMATPKTTAPVSTIEIPTDDRTSRKKKHSLILVITVI